MLAVDSRTAQSSRQEAELQKKEEEMYEMMKEVKQTVWNRDNPYTRAYPGIPDGYTHQWHFGYLPEYLDTTRVFCQGT